MAEDRRQPPPGFASHSAGKVWSTPALDVLMYEFKRIGTDATRATEDAWAWRDRMLELLGGVPRG